MRALPCQPLAAGLAWAVMLAAPAAAQEINADSQRTEILGTAPSACVIDAPVAANAVNASFSGTGVASGQIVIAQFVDPQNANPLASSIELALPVICNASHHLTVRSGNGGLLRSGGDASRRQAANRFADFVSYNLSVDWAGRTIDRASDRSTIVMQGNDARAGDLALRISTPAGGGPLTAGRYDDTIVVEFRAAN